MLPTGRNSWHAHINPWTDSNLHTGIYKSCCTGIRNRWTMNGILIHLLIPHHTGNADLSSSEKFHMMVMQPNHGLYEHCHENSSSYSWSLFLTYSNCYQDLKDIFYPSLNMLTIDLQQRFADCFSFSCCCNLWSNNHINQK